MSSNKIGFIAPYKYWHPLLSLYYLSMTIRYTLALLLLATTLANERFRTTIKAKDNLLFSEHVYREMGVKVLASMESLSPE